MQNKIYKGVKYIRLSHTDDKSTESDSVANQRRLIDDFLERNPDIEMVGEKIDDGYSGVIFDRPAFKEMMRDIMDGKVDCVIVKDLSRLGREYIETGRYLRRIFPAYGVRFIAINDNIDTIKDTSGDDLTVSVKNIMNEAYSRDISVKTRSSLEARRKNGDFVSPGVVYGYKRAEDNKNRLAVDEDAARVVRDIFRMRLEGVSAAKIAEKLNAQGILSPLAYKKEKGIPVPSGGFADKEGAEWSATTIIRILGDETYTGTLVQGRQGSPNYKIKAIQRKPDSEWARKPDAHDAIIEKHDFDLVRKLGNLDTRAAPGADKVYLFSGVLICGCCGSRMTRKTVPYKGRQYYYYYCPTGKKKGCTAPMVKEADLVDCVYSILQSHIENVVSLETVLESLSDSGIHQALARRYMAQISDKDTRVAEIERFKASLYENMVGGLLSKEEFLMMKAKYTAEVETLATEKERLQTELEQSVNSSGQRDKWMEHFKRFAALDSLTRKAVVQLIESVRIVDKTNIQVSFNYSLEYERTLSLLSETARKAG